MHVWLRQRAAPHPLGSAGPFVFSTRRSVPVGLVVQSSAEVFSSVNHVATVRRVITGARSTGRAGRRPFSTHVGRRRAQALVAAAAGALVVLTAGPASAAAPSAPGVFSASPGDTQVGLFWWTSSGATAYHVYRDGSLVATVPETSAEYREHSWLDSGRTDGTAYSYRVAAVDAQGAEGTLTAAVTSTPVALAADISREYGASGGPVGPLRGITGAGHAVAGGVQADFEHGVVLQKSGQPARAVWGRALPLYSSLGGVTGWLGWPSADAVALRPAPGFGDPSGGQVFDGGKIYWSGTGVFTVHGASWDAWGRTGWEGGALAYPTSEEIALRGGGGQAFQGGATYWSTATGAHAVPRLVQDAWGRSGYENGPLGYPTTDPQTLRGGGTGQRFAGGSVYAAPNSLAYVVRGWLGDTWAAWGYEAGRLGYPVADEVCGLRNGGCGQVFGGGSIYLSAATGSHVIGGAIRDEWQATGFENGFGYPKDDATCGLRNGGCGQNFESASIYWTPSTGAHAVHGLIGQRWAQLGYEAGRLGYPTSDEFRQGNDIEQLYAGGSIIYQSATGRLLVTVNP